MKNPNTLLLMSVCTAAAFFLISSAEEPAVLTPELITEAKYGIGNDPVLMVGCKTFHPPLPKKMEREVVAQRFINLPCALEVPPPFAALEYKKRLGNH